MCQFSIDVFGPGLQIASTDPNKTWPIFTEVFEKKEIFIFAFNLTVHILGVLIPYESDLDVEIKMMPLSVPSILCQESVV